MKKNYKKLMLNLLFDKEIEKYSSYRSIIKIIFKTEFLRTNKNSFEYTPTPYDLYFLFIFCFLVVL